MLPRLLFDQRPDEIVAVKGWGADEEHGVYPTGHKPKRALVCPAPAPHRFLRAGHRYMFKHPERYGVQQVWSEVIAYKLSQHLPIEVPPAFLAHDERRDASGVLIEFFYGYTGEPISRLVHASDRFQAHGMSFDTKRGSLRDNITLSVAHTGASAWRWWAATVAFDTLIGNTDRHSQNWGFLVQRRPDGSGVHVMAPVYDNGSSLGWVTRDDDIPATMEATAFARFIARGKHHFTWLSADLPSASTLEQLAASFVRFRRNAAAAMLPFATLSDDVIDSVLAECMAVKNFPIAFTAQRASFVRAQVMARRGILQRCLGG